jgi:hypothetical protein
MQRLHGVEAGCWKTEASSTSALARSAGAEPQGLSRDCQTLFTICELRRAPIYTQPVGLCEMWIKWTVAARRCHSDDCSFQFTGVFSTDLIRG